MFTFTLKCVLLYSIVYCRYHRGFLSSSMAASDKLSLDQFTVDLLFTFLILGTACTREIRQYIESYFEKSWVLGLNLKTDMEVMRRNGQGMDFYKYGADVNQVYMV